MPAITTQELAELIQAAFDEDSDRVINPAQARARQAQKIALAIEKFVVDRDVIIVGVQTGPSTATGKVQNI